MTQSHDIHLSQAEYEEVLGLLHRHAPNLEVLAFGSRVTGKHLKPFSDLDLVIKGAAPFPLDALLALKVDFTQSDLPFKVDVTDWHALDELMKQSILKDHVILTEAFIKEVQ